MATATGKSECVTCGKERVPYRCEGCSKIFCFNHLADHRQELNKQLDQIEDKRKIFQESLNRQTINTEKHSLVEQINQWEINSIEKIKQTAKECKDLLVKHMTQHIKKIETDFDQFTQQIKQIREENDVNEIILDQLKQNLKELKKELNEPEHISLQQDSSSFINKISVIISSPELYIPDNPKWIQNAITIAGGNGGDNGLNTLSHPHSICVDDDETIYVADCSNHRIVEWKNGATNGQVAAGGNGQGNRNDQFNGPTNVIIDKKNDCLIISNTNSKQVVRWPRRNGRSGEIIISNVYCSGLAIDNNGDLYVCDKGKHEVRRWKIGETNGTLVAGGNGPGNRLDQLSNPFYIFVDEDQSVYVSDCSNHRVMKWMKGAKEGIVVAGGQGTGSNLTQLFNPYGMTVNQLGTVYVADSSNHRVMCWLKGAKEGSVVVGGNGPGRQPNQLNNPFGLSFDRQNNLYVVDYNNSRVQKFDIE